LIHRLVLAAAAAMPFVASLSATEAAAQSGVASYYASAHHGRRTASGERFNMHAMTAAHRSAPFGSRLRVTNLANGRSVVVRVNDRGPFVRGRIVDVSSGAANALGMKGAGTARVSLARL